MTEPAERPNILLITADQWRRDACACYGNPVVRTPHIDAIAERGVRFEHAYTVSPLCMPARCSWVTGRYAHQHGVTGNVFPPIPADERPKCFPARLQQAGYRTAMVGKHHFFDEYYSPTPFDYCSLEPQLKTFGFDHVHQVIDVEEKTRNGDDFTRWLREAGLEDEFRNSIEARRKRQPDPRDPELTTDGHIGAQAVEQILGHSGDQPLFLWTSFVGPHPPYWTCEPYASMYERDAVREWLESRRGPVDDATVHRVATYYGMVSHIDDCVGRLVGALQERGWLDNTLVLVTADHGDLHGEYGIWDKRHFYEPSVGVPLIAAGGAFQPTPYSARRTDKSLVESVDVPATVLEAAGACPAEFRPAPPGVPLQQTIAQARGAVRPAVFSELGTGCMVRDPNWKLVYDPQQGGVVGLWNLIADPAEQHNLAGAPGYEPTERRLAGLLLDWYVGTSCWNQDKERERLQRVVAG